MSINFSRIFQHTTRHWWICIKICSYCIAMELLLKVEKCGKCEIFSYAYFMSLFGLRITESLSSIVCRILINFNSIDFGFFFHSWVVLLAGFPWCSFIFTTQFRHQNNWLIECLIKAKCSITVTHKINIDLEMETFHHHVNILCKHTN